MSLYTSQSHGKGSRGIASLILNLGTRWRCVVSATSRPLYSREISLVLSEYKAGWDTCSRYGPYGNGNNILALPGFEHRIIQPVRYTNWAITAPPRSTSQQHIVNIQAFWEWRSFFRRVVPDVSKAQCLHLQVRSDRLPLKLKALWSSKTSDSTSRDFQSSATPLWERPMSRRILNTFKQQTSELCSEFGQFELRWGQQICSSGLSWVFLIRRYRVA